MTAGLISVLVNFVFFLVNSAYCVSTIKSLRKVKKILSKLTDTVDTNTRLIKQGSVFTEFIYKSQQSSADYPLSARHCFRDWIGNE